MELASYLRDLKDPATRLRVADLQQLHALTREQSELLRSAWPQVPAERRRQVIRQMTELAEDNVDLNFDSVYFIALEDEDAAVRRDAVRGFWEYEGRELVAPLLKVLETDEEPEVRAEAALALGRFVLLSELGQFPEDQLREVEESLRRRLEDDLEVDEVRARALEAIGASGQSWVKQAIINAYTSDAPRLKVSAVHAMGRNCEIEWLPVLLEELTNDDPEMRYEAALALGSLADGRAVPGLTQLIEDSDLEVKEAAIAALGQIGGKEAKTVLRPLMEDPSPGVQEAVAAALAEADFSEDPLSMEHGPA